MVSYHEAKGVHVIEENTDETFASDFCKFI